MTNKSKILLALSLTVISIIMGKALFLQEEVLAYLVTFLGVGAGLAALRLFINGMITKMKGKSIVVKILFFASLLSVGLPFQSWFRTSVIFAMDASFIVPSVTVMVSSVVCMTIIYGVLYKRYKVQVLEETLA